METHGGQEGGVRKVLAIAQGKVQKKCCEETGPVWAGGGGEEEAGEVGMKQGVGIIQLGIDIGSFFL